MEYRILGAVEAGRDGAPIALGGAKQRALLAILLLDANRPVSRDRLIDGLWGESPPPSASATLDTHLSRLRQALGEGGLILRQPPGYLIRVEPDELDLDHFERLVEEANRSPHAHDRALLLDEALALWRGPALADLRSEPFASVESPRLDERRLAALEQRIDADLDTGAGSSLIPELELLVRDCPFRERFAAQLMHALYRAGRQSDALAVFGSLRRRFAEELGLSPSAELTELEQRILRHDPVLRRADERPSAAGTEAPRIVRMRHARRRLAGVAPVWAVAVAMAAAAAVGIELGAGGPRIASAGRSGSTLVELVGGVSSAATATALPEAPAVAAVGAGSVWLAEPNAGEVVRVDEATRRIVERIAVSAGPGAIAFGGGAVWVASVPGGSVLRIDPTTDAVTAPIGLGNARVGALAFGLGRLWIADTTDDALLELDPGTDTVTHRFLLDVQPTTLAIGDGGVWVADYDGGTLTRLDPRTGETLFTKPVGDGPAQVAIGKNAVWVANSLDSTVSRVDPVTGAVLATTQVGSDPVALAATTSAVWVASELADDLTRLDPYRPSHDSTIPLNARPTALAAAGGRVWVGAEPDTSRRGGTIVLLSSSTFPIDPALNLFIPQFQSQGFSTDGLVTYNNTGGPAGAQLVPDLAVAIPQPTQGGRVYTFQLLPGIRYDNGLLVHASDFRRAFERLYRLGSGEIPYYPSLVGAAACNRRRCNLARGIVTDDPARTVSFHLVAPDPGFLTQLAFIPLTPVPPGTPWRALGWTPIPGTGPYEIASASRHEIRWVRNPHFHEWSHAAQPDGNPDEIVMRFGLSPSQEVKAIEHGRADWTYDGVPAPLLAEVATKYPAQVHSYLSTTTAFLQLNTTVRPFNNLRVRQALNDAIDRATVVRWYGGPLAATPTCQILPPGLLGYQRYCPYTRDLTGETSRWQGPDLTRARRLVAESGTSGERITVWGAANVPVYGRPLVTYIVGLLDRLGYRARAHLIPLSAFSAIPQRTYEKIQAATQDWYDISPANFFKSWFTCNAPCDHHWFCHPAFDRAVRRAETLQAVDSPAAAALWARLDRELVDQAAAVPVVNQRQIDFVSARVTNYQHNPILGLVADQLQLGHPKGASSR